eukprot:TRINITY_DN10134_c0_g1_i2.p1 TRINITY_DN10134_c0_g1~~TRINITY_DN10134_c0_g1_i2.p1  ORF type:complete len:739 (+),score=183.38 TRINITY_DN10134_c0_g1_i2:126-2219(+)
MASASVEALAESTAIAVAQEARAASAESLVADAAETIHELEAELAEARKAEKAESAAAQRKVAIEEAEAASTMENAAKEIAMASAAGKALAENAAIAVAQEARAASTERLAADAAEDARELEAELAEAHKSEKAESVAAQKKVALAEAEAASTMEKCVKAIAMASAAGEAIAESAATAAAQEARAASAERLAADAAETIRELDAELAEARRAEKSESAAAQRKVALAEAEAASTLENAAKEVAIASAAGEALAESAAVAAAEEARRAAAESLAASERRRMLVATEKEATSADVAKRLSNWVRVVFFSLVWRLVFAKDTFDDDTSSGDDDFLLLTWPPITETSWRKHLKQPHSPSFSMMLEPSPEPPLPASQGDLVSIVQEGRGMQVTMRWGRMATLLELLCLERDARSRKRWERLSLAIFVLASISLSGDTMRQVILRAARQRSRLHVKALTMAREAATLAEWRCEGVVAGFRWALLASAYKSASSRFARRIMRSSWRAAFEHSGFKTSAVVTVATSASSTLNPGWAVRWARLAVLAERRVARVAVAELFHAAGHQRNLHSGCPGPYGRRRMQQVASSSALAEAELAREAVSRHGQTLGDLTLDHQHSRAKDATGSSPATEQPIEDPSLVRRKHNVRPASSAEAPLGDDLPSRRNQNVWLVNGIGDKPLVSRSGRGLRSLLDDEQLWRRVPGVFTQQ